MLDLLGAACNEQTGLFTYALINFLVSSWQKGHTGGKHFSRIHKRYAFDHSLFVERRGNEIRFSVLTPTHDAQMRSNDPACIIKSFSTCNRGGKTQNKQDTQANTWSPRRELQGNFFTPGLAFNCLRRGRESNCSLVLSGRCHLHG